MAKTRSKRIVATSKFNTVAEGVKQATVKLVETFKLRLAYMTQAQLDTISHEIMVELRERAGDDNDQRT